MDSQPPAVFTWMTALADPTRVRVLRLVERHELTVAEICSVLQLPQSTVSRHLKVLADDGWVTARPEGTSRLYRMGRDSLDPAARRLWSLLREQTATMGGAEQDDRRLQGVLASRQTRSQAFFRSAAGQWDRMRQDLFGGRFDVQAIAAWLDEDWEVGDLGCGTGQMAESLAPFVRRVIAVESSGEMLDAARRRLAALDNVELRRGELESLPIDDQSLDAAAVCLVLHHVADPPAVLREAARVLHAGGRLLLVDMFRHDRVEYRRQMGHVWLGFDEAKIGAWLAEAGFERVRMRPLAAEASAKGPALFVAAARRKAGSVANGAHANGATAGIEGPHGGGARSRADRGARPRRPSLRPGPAPRPASPPNLNSNPNPKTIR